MGSEKEEKKFKKIIFFFSWSHTITKYLQNLEKGTKELKVTYQFVFYKPSKFSLFFLSFALHKKGN